MKVAIIGSGPLAIEMALKLYLEEASVTLFSRGDLGGSVRRFMGSNFLLAEELGKITTQEGRSFLPKDIIKKPGTLDVYWPEYLKPLAEKVKGFVFFKKAEVIRVKKSFKSVKEQDRLSDLFRVYYSVNPQDSILNSIEENPMIYKNLGEEVLKSLKEKMEYFEDFDLVVDARGVLFNPLPMGSSSGLALNEDFIAKNSWVFYGMDGFGQIELIKNEIKSLMLVGCGKTAQAYLDFLQPWFSQNSLRKLYWVAENSANSFTPKIQEESELEYQRSIEYFQKEINNWKALEDYEKAKIPKPLNPERRFEVCFGSVVSALDRLLDRKGFFVTLENKKSLKTIPVDSIIVANGYQIDTSLFKGLQMDFHYGEQSAKSFVHNEPGIYTLGPIYEERRYDLIDGLEQIPKIFENMKTFFSRK